MKYIFLVLIFSIVLLGTFSAIFFYQATNNIPEETIKERVCYPAVYSVDISPTSYEVIEVEPSKCEDINR